MEDHDPQETLRLSIQTKLDRNKTALEKNMLGQFATPTTLAREILSYGLSLIPHKQQIHFLDPAIGTGAFYSALRETAGDRFIATAKGYEIDAQYGDAARQLWPDANLDIDISDFTQNKPPVNGFNLLICNPPYVRHHHLGTGEKRRLQGKGYDTANIKLSGLSGLYCYFLALSHQWMSKGGLAGWLIPSEFMDVNYGRELKHYLLNEVTLLRIHRFDPNNVQFEDAMVSSAVVWFKNIKPTGERKIEFSYGGSLSAPAISRQITSTELRLEDKWTRFPKQESRPPNNAAILSDLFIIKRGIVTGNNDFFILTKEKIVALDLPMQFFKPILPSPRHIKVNEINVDDQGNPDLPQQLFLLDCRHTEEDIRRQYPKLWNYLESGKDSVAGGYICKSRSLWYKQEERQPAPFVCNYMGRSDSPAKSPFRFMLNHSDAIAANTYLMLYPKPNIAEQINKQPGAIQSIWKELNSIKPEMLISEGRVYGGGLYKLEPKELANVPFGMISTLLGR